MPSFRVRARYTPPPGMDWIIRAPATGWRPTHTLESGVRLRWISILLPDNSRGIRVNAGDSHAFELLVQFTEEVIAVGTVWKVWHSTVHFAQFEVEEVLEVARGGETISPPSHGGNTWMVFC